MMRMAQLGGIESGSRAVVRPSRMSRMGVSDGDERSREGEYEAGVVDEAQEWYSCLASSGLVSSGLGMRLVPQADEFLDLSPETFASTGHQRFSWRLLQSKPTPVSLPVLSLPATFCPSTTSFTSKSHVTSLSKHPDSRQPHENKASAKGTSLRTSFPTSRTP